MDTQQVHEDSYANHTPTQLATVELPAITPVGDQSPQATQRFGKHLYRAQPATVSTTSPHVAVRVLVQY